MRLGITEAQEMIPTRRSLLSRLKDWDDEASWRDFFETYWRLIYLAAINSDLTDAEAQEVVQETVISVCRNMPGFQYRPEQGSFKAWLLKLTYWRIRDQLRRRRRQQREVPFPLESWEDDLGMDFPAATPELERLWEAEWKGNLMAAAVERVKRRVNSRQYQIFDLCVVQEWPVSRIVKTLKVNRGQVYLAKYRVSSQIKRELQRLESRSPMAGLAETQYES
ncbi:MAG: sigma-70 family RNA polymerase sigma factor [Verrucomicrobia bacterium]|nr:sigma-70 family RNA polymerase sigma factor [Verrucomicrobiota bacterium]